MTGNEVLHWALGIFIALIIIFILFGPEKLFAKARDVAFSFGLGKLPEDQNPEFSTVRSVPSDLEKYYENLVSKIKNSGNNLYCWIEIGKMPKASGFQIGFYDSKIQLEKLDEKGLVPTEKSSTIKDFKPCAVKGGKAVAFYDCFSNGQLCINVYESGNEVIDKDSDIAPILFKFDYDHFCVIYTFKDYRIYAPGCNRMDNLIDNACVDKIKSVYRACS